MTIEIFTVNFKLKFLNCIAINIKKYSIFLNCWDKESLSLIQGQVNLQLFP